MDSSNNIIDKTIKISEKKENSTKKNDIKDINCKNNNKDIQNNIESTKLNSKISKNIKKINYKIMEIIEIKYNEIPEREKQIIIMGEENTRKSESIKNYVNLKINIGKKGGIILKSSDKNMKDIFINNIFLINEDEFIICSYKSIINFKNLFSKIRFQNVQKIYDKSYIGGIRINNYLILTSNSLLSNGEDKLLIYNIHKENYFVIEIVGYSFVLSQNNLSFINFPDNYKTYQEKNIILLCACQNYTNKQKNGILLLIINTDNKEILFQNFYNMINYEVFCFCPIETYENNWVLEQKIFKRIDYQYILVGGFDLNKRKGLIKLFKIQFNPKIDEIKIEYIQDMIFEKSFKGKGSITSIYQNIENGIIYAIFSDGNTSSFSPPKIGIKENN